MKKDSAILGALLLAGLPVAGFAAEPWEDPEVNEVNRAPMHTSYFAFESANKADAGKEASKTLCRSTESGTSSGYATATSDQSTSGKRI